jgi:hypothetical protein
MVALATMVVFWEGAIFMITPGLLLATLLVITLIVVIVEGARHARQAERVRKLARQWGMNFGRRDTLRLTARVARAFPIPGASALRILHVVYGAQGDRYRYIFTAQYTVGVIGAKSRQSRVATLSEPRDRRRQEDALLEMTESDAPLLEQYEVLWERLKEERERV